MLQILCVRWSGADLWELSSREIRTLGGWLDQNDPNAMKYSEEDRVCTKCNTKN